MLQGAGGLSEDSTMTMISDRLEEETLDRSCHHTPSIAEVGK